MHSDILILFTVGLIASFYGTSIGGSTLLIIPVLIFLGLTPLETVATALLGYLGLNIAGILRFHRAGTIHYRTAFSCAIFAVLGTILGTHIALHLPPDIHKKGVAIMLLIITAILLWNPRLGLQSRKTGTARHMGGYIAFFLVGLYLATLLGGTAFIATSILVFFFGETMIESAGTRKIVFLCTNIIATGIYVSADIIHWQFAVTLFLSGLIGSYTGASFALRKGDTWVRWGFVIVTVIAAMKLLVS